jgi:hypothetical protein
MLNGKKWIVVFFCTFALLTSLCLIAAYCEDPFIQYGYDDKIRFWGRGKFQHAGIIDHYDYDAVIIGSSMAQHFDVSFFRRAMQMEPVKLTLAGISVSETKALYDRLQERNRVKVIMINIDMPYFERNYDLYNPFGRMPRFLYEDGILNDMQYLLMYEVWFRFIPVNMVLRAAIRLGLESPGMMHRTKIDNFESRNGTVAASKELIMRDYKRGRFSAKKENSVDMEKRMRANIDEFLEHLLKNKKAGQSLVFGFPPYSALYWYDAQKNGTFETLMSAKSFFIEKCDGTSGVRVVDTQDFGEIVDLDYYTDITHYGPYVQALYAGALLDGTKDTSKKTVAARREKLEELVVRFIQENKDWLEE